MAQLEVNLFAWHHGGRHAFDDCPVCNPASSGVVYRCGTAAPPRGKTASDYGTLSYSISFTSGGFQGGEKQQAALKIGRVAHGRHCHVDAGAGLCERRQCRNNHDGRGVVNLDHRRGGSDPHPLQKVGQSLDREDRLLPIAGSRQSHYHPIADQLVVTNALNGGNVFKPDHRCGRDRGRRLRGWSEGRRLWG